MTDTIESRMGKITESDVFQRYISLKRDEEHLSEAYMLQLSTLTQAEFDVYMLNNRTRYQSYPDIEIEQLYS